MVFIEKKDGTEVGFIQHFPIRGFQELGYSLVPNERGKGYCSEAVRLIVDYVFLSRDLVRIQACTDVANVASQKILEKAGFRKERTIRKEEFVGAEWRDKYLYGVLREEWKEPKILDKNRLRAG